MLDYVQTGNPNAIEEVFFNELEKCSKKPLYSFQSEMLIRLSVSNKKSMNMNEQDKPFIWKVIEKIIDAQFSFTIVDERSIAFLIVICESVGQAIMYLWYIQGICSKKKVKCVDLDFLCLEVFSWGVFNEKDMQRIWDGQKINRGAKMLGSDNLLDYSSARKSLLEF